MNIRSFIKYILFLFNACILSVGILVFIYGFNLYQSLQSLEISPDEKIISHELIIVAMILISGITILVSFCGCCGAFNRNVCSLMCYIIVLMILLVVQIVGIYLLWSMQDVIVDTINEFVQGLWKSNRKGFIVLQETFHCCGANGVIDYVLSASLPPPSCCPNDFCNTINFYDGCKTVFIDVVADKKNILKTTGLSVLAVEALGIILAITLLKSIQRPNLYI